MIDKKFWRCTWLSSFGLDQRIIDCIDDGSQVIGESAKYVIYEHMEKNFRLKKDEIRQHLDVFKQAITSIYGEDVSQLNRRIDCPEDDANLQAET